MKGLGFRIKGLGFRNKGLGFRVSGLGFGVWYLGCLSEGVRWCWKHPGAHPDLQVIGFRV